MRSEEKRVGIGRVGRKAIISNFDESSSDVEDGNGSGDEFLPNDDDASSEGRITFAVRKSETNFGIGD